MRVGLESDGRGARLPQGMPVAEAPGWEAELSLAFEVRQQRTVLAHSLHRGPLRVQRPFYPERDGTCHLYVLHPPGGVAGGDILRIAARLERGARVLITTPGAGKLYRSKGQQAHLCQELSIAAGACLEWFPQETIVFDAARAATEIHVQLAEDAVYAGWEIVCLGRPHSHEPFREGRLQTELTIHRGGHLRYMERGLYEGGDAVLSESWGLGGAPVFGLFVVADERADDGWVERVRGEVEARAGLFSVSLLPGILLGRYLGASTLDARATFERMFSALRPLYAGRAPVTPRIWHT